MPFAVPTSQVTTPAVSITLPEVPYSSIRQALGAYVLYVYRLYLAATSQNQINQPIQYMKYDSNGNQTFYTLTPLYNPYMSVDAMYYDLPHGLMKIDGRNNVSMLLTPRQNMTFLLEAEILGIGDLGGLSENNFKSYELATGKFGFFDDYVKQLIDGQTVDLKANQLISMNIVNNTNATILLNLLANPSSQNEIANQKTQWSWNVTGINPATNNTVSLQYKPNGATAYTTYVYNYSGSSFQDIVNALNQTGATFFYINSGGQDYIQTYNDQASFGTLDIYTSSDNVLLEYKVLTTFVGGSGNGLTINGSLVINPAPANPYDTGGTLMFNLAPGDNVNITGNISPTSGQAIVKDITNNVVLYNNTVPGSPIAFLFVVSANTTYSIAITGS